ncbi:MAG: hypothetical protein IPK31_20465 [Chitinophagaceae bacterium]|nr:hypothetical protein [Chitinophagaceae bacterium]
MISKYRRIHELEYHIVRILAMCNIWWIGCKIYRNPFTSFKVIVRLIRRISNMLDIKNLVRAYKIDGRYVWDMFHPSWPSAGFNRFYKSHLLELQPVTGNEQTIRRLLIAITKDVPCNANIAVKPQHCITGMPFTFDEFIEKIEPFVQKRCGPVNLLRWRTIKPL